MWGQIMLDILYSRKSYMPVVHNLIHSCERMAIATQYKEMLPLSSASIKSVNRPESQKVICMLEHAKFEAITDGSMLHLSIGYVK
jgi:hypothetical protein